MSGTSDKSMPIIRQGQVKLRSLSRKDLEKSRRWVNDPELAFLVDRVRPVSEAEHEAWIERAQKDPNQVVFGIETSGSGTYVGNCGLRDIDPRVRKAKLWIYIGETRWRGRGLGEDAVRALVRYGFEALNLRRIALYVIAPNTGAQKLYQKVGFKPEGRFREDAFLGGAYVDTIQMGLLKSEFNGA